MKIIQDLKYKIAKKIVDKYEQKLVTPSFWFMRDNHTFTQPKGKNINEIKQSLIEIAKKNSCGMVCGVTILEEGKPERSVGENYHVDKDGNVNLDKWYEEVIKEKCVLNYCGEKS